MRATLRITWLLLSLSFIFHSVDGENDTTTMNQTTSITSVPTTALPVSTLVSLATVPTFSSKITQMPIKTSSTTAVTTQGKTAPSMTVVTDKQTTPTTQTSGSATSAVKATTPATTLSVNRVVQPIKTSPTLTASVPSTTDGTNTTFRASADTASVGKTGISTSTGAPQVQQSTAHTITTTLKTDQVNQSGTVKTTVAAASHGQATTVPAGNQGATSISSILTKEEQTSGTTASTMTMQTTLNSSSTSTTAMTTTTTTTTAAQKKTFMYSLNNGHESEEEKELVQVCKRLMMNLQDGNCSLSWRHQNGKIHFDSVEINGNVKTNVASQLYEEITKKPTDNKTLIAILASCGALLIMIVILALCASHHRKPYNENQQHLTEELHTVENGYHDNPTLEVMEVQPEMQEKKMTLNGEFNDSWIVPMDNALKEDMLDEEDTHL